MSESNKTLQIGFLGWGEAGRILAGGLKKSGGADIGVFDLRFTGHSPDEQLWNQAMAEGLEPCRSLAELAKGRKVIISAVVASAALEAAKSAAPHLRPEQYYLDINSCSPGLKQEIAKELYSSGVRFVEAAVMSAIPPKGLAAPMLICGPHAQELANLLNPLGMVLSSTGPEYGGASAAKMLRSLVIKGIEAILQESLLGARVYGVEQAVLSSLCDTWPGLDWSKEASYLLGRTALHGPRRVSEMQESARTLEAAGVEPIIATAITERLAWAVNRGLSREFTDHAPNSYAEVLDYLSPKNKA
jgi:3-hydroxyisobutyrate dehydrogenase-like beta-hydroxyacid dehydrogenase